MREFAFTVTYERGVDELMDVFIENPGLVSHTVSCHASEHTMWRVDEVTGPEDALAEYDRVIERLTRCSSLRGMGGCEVDWRYELLDADATSRVIYSQQSEGEGCRSIPYLVASRLGDGVLVQAEQREREYVWRILAEDDVAMSGVYEDLAAHLRDGLRLEFDRVERASNWSNRRTDDGVLTPTQRDALALAVEHGYYDQPRRNSIKEIARIEDIPTSTLQYRVNRAESALIRSVFGEGASDDGGRSRVAAPTQ
ncbi:helix-turn-helix domain-containing protein (plasmid) [Halarchaeum sp. CBA1220]|uniref:helix-turn-helix domain-containing protein n=1 Tax=Halarchaeum sp. CBA1220 TaxID=1853682 RepID=UPI000F3A89AB|nr:helix-turn-helix domain-containing protein [Halarchaeum sp. CBA1220]QLC35044.1 helix-turn-helix domain-containing protein [Halarchaeum sp. CBA1220]